MNNLSVQERDELPQALLWLKDAPLFIDGDRLGDFYDAVVRPPNREGDTIIKWTDNNKQVLEGKLGLKITAGLSKWLSTFVDAKGEASGGVKGSTENSSGEDKTITLAPIHTPQRQLEQLAIFYLVRYPDRILLVDDLTDPSWYDEDFISSVPRALAFLNIPKHSVIIPTAAEFKDGFIVTFFDKMRADDGQYPPVYPSRRGGGQDYDSSRRSYWRWYVDNFQPQQAINLIEKAAAKHGRVTWIDFRMPLAAEGDTMHLHVAGGGKYETGVFAYYLIRRAYEYGIRLIGTLKSEPDMNVLAIYER